MSYCHLLSGGMANIDLTFGATVSQVIRTGAEDGVCMGRRAATDCSTRARTATTAAMSAATAARRTLATSLAATIALA